MHTHLCSQSQCESLTTKRGAQPGVKLCLQHGRVPCSEVIRPWLGLWMLVGGMEILPCFHVRNSAAECCFWTIDGF